jgi:hypothetical protein
LEFAPQKNAIVSAGCLLCHNYLNISHLKISD